VTTALVFNNHELTLASAWCVTTCNDACVTRSWWFSMMGCKEPLRDCYSVNMEDPKLLEKVEGVHLLIYCMSEIATGIFNTRKC